MNMSTSPIPSPRALFERLLLLPNGAILRAVEQTLALMDPPEHAAYARHLELAAAKARLSADLDVARKDPSAARFSEQTREADREHDQAAKALYRLLDVLVDGPVATESARETAAALRELFFDDGLEPVVRAPFKEQAAQSEALFRAYETSELAPAVAEVPMLEAHVAAFARATDNFAQKVRSRLETEVSYAEVKAENAEANERLREFAWHVAGTLTSVDASTAARRDTLLEPYLTEIDQAAPRGRRRPAREEVESVPLAENLGSRIKRAGAS